MSLRKVHLRKLLQLFYLPENKLITEIKAIIRQNKKKEDSHESSGGDFHAAFWADAKNHAAGLWDLSAATKERINKNQGRERLYQALEKSFLSWWDEKRRWKNEPFKVINSSRIKGKYIFQELDAAIKVENLFCVQVGTEYERLIYPYFSEFPPLGNEAFRLGNWVVSQALNQHAALDVRILDILRSKSAGLNDYPLNGDEREKFLEHYTRILSKIEKLEKEY